VDHLAEDPDALAAWDEPSTGERVVVLCGKRTYRYPTPGTAAYDELSRSYGAFAVTLYGERL
jgi:hypothetical protein